VIPNAADNDFNVPAFAIAVREAMEGCVITAILLSTLHKSGQDHMKKYVWFGVLIGTGSFLIVGAVCLTIFYAAGENMPQAVRAGFEGIFALVAMVILTHISFKFLRLRDMIHKWQNLLIQKKQEGGQAALAGSAAEPQGCWGQFMVYIKDFRDALNIRHQAINEDTLKADPQGLQWKEIVLITFSAIFREGLETVIFLLPMTTQSTPGGTTIAALTGIVVGIVFGIMVLYVGKKCLLDPTIFFMATAAFVFFIAAGLSTYTMVELEQIPAVNLIPMNHPVFMRPVYNIGCLHEAFGRSWRNVMDTHCLLPESTGFDRYGVLQSSHVGLIFRALLGYRATPTYLMCIVYCLYWIIVTSIMMWRYKKGTLFSRFGITDGLKGISEKGAEVPITKSGDVSMQAWQGQPTSGNTMMMPMLSPTVALAGQPMQPMQLGPNGAPFSQVGHVEHGFA